MIDWLNLAWPMMAAACLTLGLIHGFVWMQGGPRYHLAFAIAASSVAFIALLELHVLNSRTTTELASLMLWRLVPVSTLVFSLIWFIHSFVGPGSLVLGFAAAAVRALALVLNFTTGHNLYFVSIDAVHRIDWWGGVQVSHAVGTANPWALVAQLSNVLLVAFILTSLAGAWRRGDREQRRTALIICLSWIVFVIVMLASYFWLVVSDTSLPLVGAPSFLLVVLATSYLLGTDLSRSSQLNVRLQQAELRSTRTEQDLAMAATAGELELWTLELAPAVAPPASDGPPGNGGDPPTPLESLLARVHADDSIAVEQALARALETGRFECEFRETQPGGDTHWMSAQGEVEFDAQGRPCRVRGVSRKSDGPRVAAEQFRSLFDSSPIALMFVDQLGNIAMANHLLAAIFGSSPKALQGRPVESLVSTRHHDSPIGLPSGLTLAAPGILGGGDDLIGRQDDGSEVPIEVGVKQIGLRDGVYTLVTVTDISERRRTEADAAQQLDELAHLSRVTMIGELSGALAHELNQPLTAILSNAQTAQRILANDPGNTPYLQEILADIVDDDRRAGEVIRRMRAMLKKGHVEHAPVDTNSLVQGVLRLIRSDLIHRGVGAEVDLAPDLPRVKADAIQLQQVLVNLIFNACDAMEGLAQTGVVTVTTAQVEDGSLRVSVEDVGPGIAPERLERIFQPFETTKDQGMGLGLPICRSILDAHAGRIWAENRETGGARVCFEISGLEDGK